MPFSSEASWSSPLPPESGPLEPGPPEFGTAAGTESGSDDLLNINEIAAALRVSKMTVYRFIHDGRLPALRLGRSLRVYRGDLEAYLGAAYLQSPGEVSRAEAG